jgi:hypothetical protein
VDQVIAADAQAVAVAGKDHDPLIRHGQGKPHTILPSVAYLSSPYFSTLFHKRHDFRGKSC